MDFFKVLSQISLGGGGGGGCLVSRSTLWSGNCSP